MEIFSDNRYIEEVLGGNTAAFEPVVRKYQDRIFAFVIRIVKSEEDAKDVTQEVFLKAFRKLDTFHGDAKFSSWLFQIAYHTAISQTRLQQKMMLQEDERKQLNSGEEAGNPMSIMLGNERKRLVNQAIGMLPENEAAIVNLFYLEELSIQEIAEIMQLSEANVKVKLHRIRKKLSEQLKKILIL